MDINTFFQWGAIPSDAMEGSYNLNLVLLSYFIASLASYVALDITERIRTSGESFAAKIGWLIGGAFAMGIGIWTMHFIGMLAFIMPMPMSYDPSITLLSMIFAVIASGLAFYLIKNDRVRAFPLMMGGIFMGLGIVSMHYTGMSAMLNVEIHYIPSLFFLSIFIAIVTSEVALWLMIKSSNTSYQYQKILKFGSSLLMGFAICGMHYTGMGAAIFYHTEENLHTPLINNELTLSLNVLSLFVAISTVVIMSIALIASRIWLRALQHRNKILTETEASLEKKSQELQKVNEDLSLMAKNAEAKKEEIRAILTAAADGIVVTNDKGVIKICNRAAEEILGDAAEAMIQREDNISNVFGQCNSKQSEFTPIKFENLIHKNENSLELWLQSKKTHKHLPIELNVSKSKINKNEFYIFVFRDITQRKISEENLSILNQKLVSTARLAGMAEVASCVLHNVGNTLNSINVSAQTLLERDYQTNILGLKKLSSLLKSHEKDMEIFFRNDPVGKILPNYLEELSTFWENEMKLVKKEIEDLTSKIHHVKQIVVMQQSLSGVSNVIDKVQINELLDDALSINTEILDKYNISVKKDYANIIPFNLDKVKTLQALVNLIKNAIEALSASNTKEKVLTLRTTPLDANFVNIEVTDNGIGIEPENLSKIFNYGFTTKKEGHGFGLHSSALSIQESGGSLKAFSQGKNKGSTFVLSIPKNQKAKELKK